MEKGFELLKFACSITSFRWFNGNNRLLLLHKLCSAKVICSRFGITKLSNSYYTILEKWWWSTLVLSYEVVLQIKIFVAYVEKDRRWDIII